MVIYKYTAIQLKKSATFEDDSIENELSQLPIANSPRFFIDLKIEAQKYYIFEKKSEMIELNAKLESLDLYQSL